MPLALSFILFAILGAVYGAILYGMLPTIAGDLPKGDEEIDISYIEIKYEYICLKERIGSSGVGASVLVLYPLVHCASNCSQHYESSILLVFLFMLVYAAFAFAVYKIVSKRFPRFEIGSGWIANSEFWRISEILAKSIKRMSFSLAAYIMNLVLLILVSCLL